MENLDYFAELEKIANAVIAPEDLAADPMVTDPQPQLLPEEVEAIQAANSEVTAQGAEEQQPASPEEVAALEAALVQAEGDLAEAKQVLAHWEEEDRQFEKTANYLSEVLPQMGALATLIDFSTNENIEESFRKLASERLIEALKSEEAFEEVLAKTASELFETDESLEDLYSRKGTEYVVEHLASFVSDQELEKAAFEIGGVVNTVKDTASEVIDATKKFHRIHDEIRAAQAQLDVSSQAITANEQAIQAAKASNDVVLEQQLRDQYVPLTETFTNDINNLQDLKHERTLGGVGVGVGATGVVGGAYGTGKGIHNLVTKDPEEELSEKMASDTINQEESVNYEGGYPQMSSIVKDFLKIAGAAALIDAANNEQVAPEHRKEAATAFNSIARLSRAEMEENLVKVATQLYSEDQLHQIVSGQHNEELFSKIAFFTEANELSVDELEKIAGADSVAAKGVGGALTDAKANIVEKIEQDKVKTETVANGELGTLKADDTRAYNVINNPAEYQVDKTAALRTMLDEAEFRKEAAYRAYVEADSFIRSYVR